MSIQEFINKYNGQYIASRGGITGQCVSLVQRFAEENGVGGTPVFPVPAAKDMVNIRLDAFDWIGNTPSNVPQPGDIIVFGTAVGPYGHTSVFEHGDSNSFVSFDQNWPGGSAAHRQDHNYNGVLGWLRLKGQDNMGQIDDLVNANFVLTQKVAELEQRVKDEVANHKFFEDLSKAQSKQIDYLKAQIAAGGGGSGVDQQTKDDIGFIKTTVQWIKDKLSNVFK